MTLYLCLSNSRFSLYNLLKAFLVDEQSVNLIILDDMCIFAPLIDSMLDHIEIDFYRLKRFNIKPKPKNVIFQSSVVFLE